MRDDGGTADGGVDLDQTANTITFDVASVNDEPDEQIRLFLLMKISITTLLRQILVSLTRMIRPLMRYNLLLLQPFLLTEH
ncbi:MAG: hypothetical protein R3D88_06505 [Alphaproteobacteria bacterium]